MEKEITINGVTYVPKEQEKTEKKSEEETMLLFDCSRAADDKGYSVKVESYGRTPCIVKMWLCATKELFNEMGMSLSAGAFMLSALEIRDKHEKD